MQHTANCGAPQPDAEKAGNLVTGGTETYGKHNCEFNALAGAQLRKGPHTCLSAAVPRELKEHGLPASRQYLCRRKV